MSLGLVFVVALVVCLGILAVAVILIRHQRTLEEKKAQYMNARKECSFHRRRYENYQADIDRLRASFNSRMRDLNLIVIEMENKKKEIREIIDILKAEEKGTDEEMEQDLTRIIERRKGMLKKQWQAYNGQKASYLDRLDKALKDRDSMDGYLVKKDEEFKKWHALESRMGKLKSEYENLMRNPVFSFGNKKKG